MKYNILFIYVLLVTNQIDAQEMIPVFPDLDGEKLLEHVISEYTPIDILNYSDARDTLFSKIDSQNDSLTCVYSGHTIYIDPIKDPTQAAFMNGIADGINTEHTYPQSMGAEIGNARSDMHHLFPTRTAVNSVRGNKPFDDIHDSITDSWYYLNNSTSEIPDNSIIDLYSESSADSFEPRESHKGNVARAMFYFYTIYREEAIAANVDFFKNQQETLCQWHIEDPVDQSEFDRTLKIASYQEDKVNPFIYDCTLANRLYCPNISCESTAIDELNTNEFTVYPNPTIGSVTIELALTILNTNIQIIDMRGRVVKSIVTSERTNKITLDLSDIPSGIYIIQVNDNGRIIQSQILSVI